MTGTKKTRDVGLKAHEVTSYNLRSEDPAEHEAHLEAWQRFADSQPKDEPGDGPFDALRRQNAERCREIIRKEGLGDLLEGDGRVNTFTLRTRGFDEASAGWIAAKWLNTYHHLQDCRANLINGDTGVENVATMIEHAEELGKLQERLWWRCGVDRETKEKRESLALTGKPVKRGQKDAAERTNKQHAPMRERRFARMRALIPSLGVEGAAHQCEAEGLGRWDAIRRQWDRHK